MAKSKLEDQLNNQVDGLNQDLSELLSRLTSKSNEEKLTIGELIASLKVIGVEFKAYTAFLDSLLDKENASPNVLAPQLLKNLDNKNNKLIKLLQDVLKALSGLSVNDEKKAVLENARKQFLKAGRYMQASMKTVYNSKPAKRPSNRGSVEAAASRQINPNIVVGKFDGFDEKEQFNKKLEDSGMSFVVASMEPKEFNECNAYAKQFTQQGRNDIAAGWQKLLVSNNIQNILQQLNIAAARRHTVELGTTTSGDLQKFLILAFNEQDELKTLAEIQKIASKTKNPFIQQLSSMYDIIADRIKNFFTTLRDDGTFLEDATDSDISDKQRFILDAFNFVLVNDIQLQSGNHFRENPIMVNAFNRFSEIIGDNFKEANKELLINFSEKIAQSCHENNHNQIQDQSDEEIKHETGEFNFSYQYNRNEDQYSDEDYENNSDLEKTQSNFASYDIEQDEEDNFGITVEHDNKDEEAKREIGEVNFGYHYTQHEDEYYEDNFNSPQMQNTSNHSHYPTQQTNADDEITLVSDYKNEFQEDFNNQIIIKEVPSSRTNPIKPISKEVVAKPSMQKQQVKYNKLSVRKGFEKFLGTLTSLFTTSELAESAIFGEVTKEYNEEFSRFWQQAQQNPLKVLVAALKARYVIYEVVTEDHVRELLELFFDEKGTLKKDHLISITLNSTNPLLNSVRPNLGQEHSGAVNIGLPGYEQLSDKQRFILDSLNFLCVFQLQADNSYRDTSDKVIFNKFAEFIGIIYQETNVKKLTAIAKSADRAVQPNNEKIIERKRENTAKNDGAIVGLMGVSADQLKATINQILNSKNIEEKLELLIKLANLLNLPVHQALDGGKVIANKKQSKDLNQADANELIRNTYRNTFGFKGKLDRVEYEFLRDVVSDLIMSGYDMVDEAAHLVLNEIKNAVNYLCCIAGDESFESAKPTPDQYRQVDNLLERHKAKVKSFVDEKISLQHKSKGFIDRMATAIHLKKADEPLNNKHRAAVVGLGALGVVGAGVVVIGSAILAPAIGVPVVVGGLIGGGAAVTAVAAPTAIAKVVKSVGSAVKSVVSGIGKLFGFGKEPTFTVLGSGSSKPIIEQPIISSSVVDSSQNNVSLSGNKGEKIIIGEHANSNSDNDDDSTPPKEIRKGLISIVSINNQAGKLAPPPDEEPVATIPPDEEPVATIDSTFEPKWKNTPPASGQMGVTNYATCATHFKNGGESQVFQNENVDYFRLITSAIKV